jgi:hypothetical protein
MRTPSHKHDTLVVWLLLSAGIVAKGEEFYVLQGVDKSHSDELLTAPWVKGFTIRVSWQKLHEEGFAWLDQQIERGDELDVDIQLRVMAGSNAPENLPGVDYFQYLTNQDGSIESRTAPVPWDPEMHLHWRSLVSQLAIRYGNNPRVKVVHIPGFANSSEMHVPDEIALLPGYSSPVLAESWALMAEPLVDAFSGAIISLNYATPTQSQLDSEDSDWLLDQLAAMAGYRAGYQANDLSANVALDREKYQTLVEQQQLGRSIGFQMVSMSDSSRFGGEFLDAVATSVDAGGQWLEIYVADVENIPPPGDYNLNGAVDGADYVVWRRARGTIANLATDGMGSKVIGLSDYLFWKSHFGETSEAAPAGSGSSHTAAPEPATWSMVLLAITAINCRRSPGAFPRVSVVIHARTHHTAALKRA